jgi:hypothetical protein
LQQISGIIEEQQDNQHKKGAKVMTPAAEILVGILSVTLSVFLIVGIILVIYLIKLTRDIRKVTESAGRAVGNIESFFSKVSKVASPMFIMNAINKFFKKSNKKGE